MTRNERRFSGIISSVEPGVKEQVLRIHQEGHGLPNLVIKIDEGTGWQEGDRVEVRLKKVRS